jgi:hypothetical protein
MAMELPACSLGRRAARDDDEHRRQLRDDEELLLLRSRLRAAPTGFLAVARPSIPLPLLCSAREVVGGRGRWWARRWLQEPLHRAKSEGGGGRRDFGVADPVPRCTSDSGKTPL